jgi:hypothetical protein
VNTAGDGDASSVRAITVDEEEVTNEGLSGADVESVHGSLLNSSWSETWSDAELDRNTTVTDAATVSHTPSSIPLGRQAEDTINSNNNGSIANDVTPRIARRIVPLRWCMGSCAVRW